MKLSPEQSGRALALLDVALGLPEAQHEAWLAGLPEAADSPLLTMLRRMLAQHRQLAEERFLTGQAWSRPDDDAPEPTDTLAAGDTVGPWRLERALGRGGMASVWLAGRADGAHQRPVALKLPDTGSGGVRARVLIERFARERTILSTLQHPHIAQVLDAGVAGGQPWLALEYVQGRSITEYADARQLGVRARLRLIVPVLHALQHAHARLVVHRDIKPANVIVDETGVPKLLDFGVAKLLAPGDVTGGPPAALAPATALTQLGGRAMTLNYASPEQVGAQPLSTATDVYSVGVLLFELLTGRLPYRLARDTNAALEEAITRGHTQRASQAAADPARGRVLRGELDTLLAKALQLDPALRYASAEAFAQDIERWLADEPILAQPDSLAYRLRKLWARQRLPIAAAALVAVALVGGTALALWQARQARLEAARAQAVQAFLLDIFRTNSALQTDPLRARQTTARELLDIGAERIASQLKDEPVTRLTVLQALRTLYQELALPDTAAALAREAIGVATGLHGPVSVAALAEHVNLVKSLEHSPDNERAQAVEGMLEVASALRGPNDERVRAFAAAGNYFRSRDLARAARLGQQAIDEARAVPGQARLADALFEAGTTAQQQGELARAEALYDESVTLARELTPHAADLVRQQVMLAEVQARQLRIEPALASLQRARDDTLRLNGIDHLDTRQTLMRQAVTLAAAGRVRAALDVLEPLRDRMRAAPKLDAFTWPQVASAIGQEYTRLGRLGEAEAILRDGLAVVERDRPNTRTAAELRDYLVDTLVAAGRLAEAEALHAEAGRIRQAQNVGPGQRAWAPQGFAALALARARGDAAGARAALAGIVPGSDGDSTRNLPWIRGTLTRAHAEIDLGEARAAAARLGELDAVLAREGLRQTLPLLEGRRLALCARLDLQAGQAARARSRLDAAAALYRRELPPEALWMRDLASIASAVPGVPEVGTRGASDAGEAVSCKA